MRITLLFVVALVGCAPGQDIRSQNAPPLEDAPHVSRCGADLSDVAQNCTPEEVTTEWTAVVGKQADQQGEVSERSSRDTYCDAGAGLKVGVLASYIDGAKVEWVAAKHPTWCQPADGVVGSPATNCIAAVQKQAEVELTSIGCLNNWLQGQYHDQFLRGRFPNSIVTDPALYGATSLLMLEKIPDDWSSSGE